MHGQTNIKIHTRYVCDEVHGIYVVWNRTHCRAYGKAVMNLYISGSMGIMLSVRESCCIEL